MSAVMQSKAYPVAMDQKLQQVCHRQLVLTAVRALLLGASALLATMLVAMAVDWCFTLFSPTARALLTLSALSVTVTTLFVAAVGPITAALGLRRAAREVDRATPQLEERWTTVANFVESNHRPRSAIGKAMLRQVTSEAVAMGRLVEPATVVKTRSLRRAVKLFAAAATLTMTVLAVNWQHNLVLLQRFWSPLANITATQLECLSGDLVVPRGEPVELLIQMSGLLRDKAVIELASVDADEEFAELIPTEQQPDQFRYSIAALDSSFRYRVQAGDGRTKWHSVTAINRPALAEVKMTLTAPAYVDRPVYEKDYLPARVQAVQGTVMRLQMRPAAPLKSFHLEIQRDSTKLNGQADKAVAVPNLLLTADQNGWYRFEAILEEDVTITPELLSPHDLTMDDPQKCSIRVIPDRAPTARVISPSEEMAVSPDGVVEVQFEAHDDHGIAKAELVVYEESPVDGDPPTILSVEEILLDDQQNAPHVLAAAKLDLSKYDLQKGAKISYAIRVTDNRLAMRKQTVSEESAPTKSRHAGETETKENTKTQMVDRSRPDAKGLPAERAPSDEMRSKPDLVSPGKAGPDETATANSDPKSPAERSNAEAMAKSDALREEKEPIRNPRSAAEPIAAKDTDSSGGNSKQGEVKSSSKEGEQPGAERIAKSELPKDSQAATESNNLSASADSRKTNGETKLDSEFAKTLDKPASALEAPQNADSKVARAPSTKKTSDGRPEDSAESKSTSEVPGNGEVTPKLADAKESESSKSKAGAIVEPAARGNDERPMTNQSIVSGDLTSVSTHPTMTDDLNGQFTESNRLRLTIEAKLISAAAVPETGRETIQMKIRQRLEQIDRELKPAEEVLSSLIATVSQSGIADPQITKLTGVDAGLAKAEEIIADLRKESKDSPYAFAGLHMVDIGMAQITPARDRVFVLIRQPDIDPHSNVAEALHRVSRARELLAELLVRYERVLREERLANGIEETAKFYEAYVANLHRFLRAQSKPNPNPLQRKLAIVDVDQDYLDRLRQITEMRRDLMAEFGRMLADDPRLLSKYMDLLKRRQTSLRDRLTELRERQEVIATELSGWLRVPDERREDVWILAAEVRLQDIAPLVQEASQLEERNTSQFPLSLDRGARTSFAVLNDAKQLAVSARSAAAKARRLLRDPSSESVDLASDMDQIAFWLAELDAALGQLAFDNSNEETTDFTNKRLTECRQLFERIVGWTEMASHLQARRFDGLAKVDQGQLALRTELLRIEIDGIDEELATEFRGEVPESVSALAIELKQHMEGITFNQAAATFELESKRLREAESQQTFALEGFKRAEELFDQIRRKVIEELDQIDPQDPNIADLRDPTLDELLERLEREPDLNALLGLPNRPQNLRIISDFVAQMEGSTPVPLALEEAAEQARKRAKEEEKEARRMRPEPGEGDDKTEEEWRQVADAEEAQEKLQEKIEELKRRADQPNTEPEEAERLRQTAQQLEQMKQNLAGQPIDKRQWEEMIRTDQMQAILRAAARGEPLPDTQWNRLMSSLDEGLWQVKRRTPPEEFRQAIEQYQERIRKLNNLESADDRP